MTTASEQKSVMVLSTKIIATRTDLLFVGK